MARRTVSISTDLTPTAATEDVAPVPSPDEPAPVAAVLSSDERDVVAPSTDIGVPPDSFQIAPWEGVPPDAPPIDDFAAGFGAAQHQVLLVLNQVAESMTSGRELKLGDIRTLALRIGALAPQVSE